VQVNDLRRFFEQRAEIYGSTFYLDLLKLADFSKLKDREEASDFPSFTEDELSKNFFAGVEGGSNAPVACLVAEEDFSSAEQKDLFEKIIGAIEFQEEEISCIKFSRFTSEEHTKSIQEVLNAQLRNSNSKIALVFGESLGQIILSNKEPLDELRKRKHVFAKTVDVFVTNQLRDLQNSTDKKRETWADVQGVRQHYDQIIAAKPSLKSKV